MPTVLVPFFEACKQLTDTMPKSGAGQFWYTVKIFWVDYWPWITVGLTVMVVYELATRHGSSHYNSRNGFSPGFNRIIGSGVYALIQGLLYLLFHWIFGDGVYFYLWPLLVHWAVFKVTKLFLLATGFWVY